MAVGGLYMPRFLICPYLEQLMHYWIAILDKAQIAPDHTGWMTAEEALASGRRAIADGHSVVELQEPNGRVWSGEELQRLIASSDRRV
jgi:hypothetical protein